MIPFDWQRTDPSSCLFWYAFLGDSRQESVSLEKEEEKIPAEPTCVEWL